MEFSTWQAAPGVSLGLLPDESPQQSDWLSDHFC